MEKNQMSSLSDIGAVIEARPWDDTTYASSAKSSVTIVDRTPFLFLVENLLIDSSEVIGIYGRVIPKHGRYGGLVCSAIIRVDDPGWTKRCSSIALLKVGLSRVGRVPGFDARHPDGTYIDTYPHYTSGGEVVVR